MPVAARVSSRLLAIVLDTLVLAGLAVLLLVAAIQLGVGVDEPVTGTRALLHTLAGSGVLRAVPWCSLPLLAGFRCLFDATPGQLLAGVRVVAADGGAPSAWRVLARVPALLLALLPLAVGVLWILRDPGGRGLHDRLTGTRVVEEDESRLTLASLEAAL